MFLLCNTLLVFVGLTKSFSSSSTDDDDDKPSNNSQYIEVEDEEVGVTKSFSSTSCDSDDDKPSNNSEVLSSSQYIEEEEDYSQSHIFDVEVNEPMLEREAENTTSGPNDKNAVAEEEKVEENIENIILTDEEQGEEMKEQEENEEVELFDEDDEEGDKGSEIDYVPIEENNIEKEEEEESNRLSTEELNKKFEDFIRKMKEDLRIVPRRNLVMV
ncbi:hypothetical protein RYX36_005491 [Vicia faba]